MLKSLQACNAKAKLYERRNLRRLADNLAAQNAVALKFRELNFKIYATCCG